MSNIPARVPYSFLEVAAPPPGSKTPVASAADVNRELQRIQRQQVGMFQPRAIVHGMGGSPSPYVVRATDWLILVDASGGAISLTFPDAARLDGLLVTVIKTDSSANAVTLTATINGVANPTLATQYASKIIQAGNGVWYSAPRLTAPDIGPGKFPSGNYEFPNSVTVDGTLTVVGVSTFAGVTATTGNFTDTTDSSSSTTGALKTAGGLGVAKKLFVGSTATIASGLTVSANGITVSSGPSSFTTLSTSGNVGVGTTALPSVATEFSIALGPDSNFMAESVAGTLNSLNLTQNARFNGTAWFYIESTFASNYYQFVGTHNWRTAPSGTAGGAVTWQDAMKLDNDATTGNTRLFVYDVTAGTLVRVSRGAADSGGVGFRLLRVPN